MTLRGTRDCEAVGVPSCDAPEHIIEITMRLRRPLCLAVITSIVSAGCATASKDVGSVYVSPLQYQSYDCEQLNAEARRIQTRVAQLGGRLDEAASNDQAITALGVILFWPALFALGGTKQQEADYARLKGEYDAIEQASIQKRCATRTASAAPGSTGPAAATVVAQPAAPTTSVQPAAPTISMQAAVPTASMQPASVPSGGSLSGTQTAANATFPILHDKSLTVGSKTVVLGGNQWFLLGESGSSLAGSTEPWASSGSASVATIREVKASTRTALEINGQSLGRVVVITANASNSGGLSTWNVDPCKVSATRLRDTFAGNFGQPECLYVRDVSSALAPEGTPIANAVRWALASRMSVPPEYSETVYAKYGGGGFLHITVFVPRNAADQGVGAVGWARSLADSMRPLAEGRRSSAYIPE